MYALEEIGYDHNQVVGLYSTLALAEAARAWCEQQHALYSAHCDAKRGTSYGPDFTYSVETYPVDAYLKPGMWLSWVKADALDDEEFSWSTLDNLPPLPQQIFMSPHPDFPTTARGAAVELSEATRLARELLHDTQEGP